MTAATDRLRLQLVPALERPRRTLPPRIGYAVAALVVGLGLFASVTPSPLYRSYSVLWHFSPLTLTLIYATYAFGVRRRCCSPVASPTMSAAGRSCSPPSGR
jgi:hypothetical protein